jgi:predicted O-methyltransferase YrrM
MPSPRTLIRTLLHRVIRSRDIDLTLVAARLRDLHFEHAQISAIDAAEDDPARPSERLLDLMAACLDGARRQSFDRLHDRNPPSYFHLWPGEHYRLLAALVAATLPAVVVEIGTFRGLGSLALLDRLGPTGRLVTFDLVPWSEIPGTCLRAEDFKPGRFEQSIADLTDLGVARANAKLLGSADLVFIDAAKDGVCEDRLLANLQAVGLKENALVVFDDTRVWNMLRFWRGLPYPKCDFTSVGHWSGTGVMEWRSSLSGAPRLAPERH